MSETVWKVGDGATVVAMDGGTRRVRIIAVDRRDPLLPIVGLYEDATGECEGVASYAASDLTPAPKKRTAWVTAAFGPESAIQHLFSSFEKPNTRNLKLDNFSCCVRVELEEGRWDE